MWRKILTIAFVFLFASIANAQSVILQVPLANTEWEGGQMLAGNSQVRFVFMGSTVTMYDRDGATPGTWEQNGLAITMRFHEGTLVYTGTMNGQWCDYRGSFYRNSDDFYVLNVAVACRGASLTGTARNAEGRSWTWNLSTPPMDVEVYGIHEETPFTVTIRLGSDGRGTGEVVLGREIPEPARLMWHVRLGAR
jgi:hypothetical protein